MSSQAIPPPDPDLEVVPTDLAPEWLKWYLLGRYLLRKGQARLALACYDASLDHDPDHLLAWWEKGIALGDCDPTIKSGYSPMNKSVLSQRIAQCYEEALRLDPNILHVKLNLANAYGRLNYFEEEARLLQELVDSDLSQPLPISVTQLYERLLHAYFSAGSYKQVIDVAKQAKQRGIESDELSHLSTIAGQEPLLFSDWTLGPLTRAYQEIGELSNLDLIDEARVLLDDIILQHGPSAAAASAKFTALFQERWKSGEAASVPLTEKRVDTSLDIFAAWARTATEEGDSNMAAQILSQFDKNFLPFYKKAVDENPHDSNSWENYIRCLIHLGRLHEALEVCHEGVNCIPKPHRSLSLLHAELESIDNPSKTLGLLYWLEQDFSSLSPLEKLLQVRCLTRLGREDEAKEALQHLFPDWPDDSLAARCHELQRFQGVMSGDPILDLASLLHLLPLRDQMALLCQRNTAAYITDSSINTICDYLFWWLDQLSAHMPAADSEEFLQGFAFGSEGHWTGRLIMILAIGNITYHAARLYAQPSTLAWAAFVLAHIYHRAGFGHVALPLFSKAAEAAQQGERPDLLVQSHLQMATIYTQWSLPGKAWREIVAVLPQAKQVAPIHQGDLWAMAAEILNILNRTDEAMKFYQHIVDMPEAADLPPPHVALSMPLYQELNDQEWVEVGLNAPSSLRDYAELMLRLWSEALRHMIRVITDVNIIGESKALHPSGEFGEGIFASTPHTLSGATASVPSFPPTEWKPESNAITIELDLPEFKRTKFIYYTYHGLFDALQNLAESVVLRRSSIVRQQEGSNFLRAWAALLEALIDIGIRVSLPHRALEWFEVFKTTTLIQRLGLQVGPCPEGIDPDEWIRLCELVRNYRLVVESELDETTTDKACTNLNASQIEAAIHKLTSSLRLRYPTIPQNLGVFNLHRGLPSSSALQGLPAGSCILEYFTGATRGGCWLISPEDPKHPLWAELPGLTRQMVGVVAEKLAKAQAEWKKARAEEKQTRIRDACKQFEKAIEDSLVFIQDIALRPLETFSAYQTAKHFVIIPHGATHALPFHAAIDLGNTTVSYAPSLTILAQMHQVPQQAHVRALLAADSLPNCSEKQCSHPSHWALPAARTELSVLEKLFSRHSYEVNIAKGQDVTVGWLESHLSNANIAHISTHAFFEAARPSKSGLLLAQGELPSSDTGEGLLHWSHEGLLTDTVEDAIGTVWTLRRILQRADLSRCRLLFLAGCETSVVHWEEMVDEFLGLPGGFLQSGVATVIGSMWNVGGLPTLFCTYQFYKNLLGYKYSPSQALARAQEGLRTLTARKLLEEEAGLLLDYYQLRYNEQADSAKDALRCLHGGIPPLDVPLFCSPFFWAAFRCIGLP